MNLQQHAQLTGIRKRMGYYVENVFFHSNINQAKARAAWLSTMYGRPVDIVYVYGESQDYVVVYRVMGKHCEAVDYSRL